MNLLYTCTKEARKMKNAIKLNTVDYALSLHNETTV